MNVNALIVTFLVVGCLTTSFQCQKCGTGTLRLDHTKTWFPLKGRTALTFLDNTGTITSFPLRVVDTTETASNDCGEPFNYEYIHATLYLNQGLTDSIHFSLASSGWLCITAISNGEPNVSMCNVFGQTREGRVAQKLTNYTVGNRTYAETIVMLSSPALNDNIDSIFIANHEGIVGFSYGDRKYALQ